MSDTKKFLKLLYEAVVPEKLRTAKQVELTGRETKSLRPEAAAIPPYRYHSQYSTQLDRLGTAGKYMSRQFNAYCSEAGVQCTVMMDPKDFQQLFHFTNNGDRLLRIEYNDEFHYLEPKESIICKVRHGLHGEPTIPRVTALNNGNPDA